MGEDNNRQASPAPAPHLSELDTRAMNEEDSQPEANNESVLISEDSEDSEGSDVTSDLFSNDEQQRRSTTVPALVVDVSTTSNDDPLKGIISETMIVTPTSASPTGSKTSDDDFLILSFREDNDEHSERIKKLTKPTFDCFLVYRTETNYGFELKFKKMYGLSDAFALTVPVHVQGIGSNDDEDEEEDDKDSTKRLLDDKEKQNLLHGLILQNDDFYERICNTVECSNRSVFRLYCEQRVELNDTLVELYKKKKFLKKWINAHSKQRDKLHRKDKRYERVVIELDEQKQLRENDSKLMKEYLKQIEEFELVIKEQHAELEKQKKLAKANNSN